MGVKWDDCDVVAELLGTKTFLNEFVAYIRLSDFIKNRREMLDGRTISVSINRWYLILSCRGRKSIDANCTVHPPPIGMKIK